jgi:hypothetical protein
MFFIPTLAIKKPFWISHLKLAESREIELNNYVQRVIKLPMKISHNNLVLQFFESQTSDPKPAKFVKNILTSNNNKNFSENSGTNSSSNSIEDDMIEYDNDIDYDVEENENVINTSSHNNESEEINLGFDNYDNDFYDNEDEDQEDDEENEDTDDLSSNLSGFNLKKMSFHNSISKKRAGHKEAGLWWDEDNALNELTSSISFDFSSMKNNKHLSSINHQQNNKNNNNNILKNTQQHQLQQDQSFELETLKSLESLFKNSDLFSNQNESSNKIENNNINSHKNILTSSSNNIVRRLSIS